MKDEFLNYYELELDFIRRMGAEFATAHPAVASKLQLEASLCADPHVERLLEGFAFLTARIRKKIDDEYPEITDALLSMIYPHFQRPIPSMAVVQFIPSVDATKTSGGHLIPRHVELKSPSIRGGSPCRFRTAYPVTLWPISVESALLTPNRVTIAGKPAGSVALLQMELRCTAPEDWGSLEGFDSLRFHLSGDEPVPTSNYEALFNDLCEVWVQGKLADGLEKMIVLPPSSIEPVGFLPDDSILPYPNRSFPGYRLLQEYFAFPQKFLFFEIQRLDFLRSEKFVGPVNFLFFLKQSPRHDIEIRKEHFRLGCSPIVNLFEMTAEPIRLNRLKTSYPIVPKYGERDAIEVYSVDKVVSFKYLEGAIEFDPFYAMKPGPADPLRKEAYWYASRRQSLREGDEGIEVELSFTDPDFSPELPSVEKIAIHLTCTNRDVPSQLPFGGNKADFSLESDAPVGRVRLLTKPTRTFRPPIGRSAQWAAITHLALNHLSLVDSQKGPQALRELLTIYDFQRSAVTRKIIDAIVGVSSKRIAGRTGNRMANTVSLGVEVTLVFDEEVHSGSGAFLTASVLERFLGSYVTINSFTQMVARSKQREGEWKRWPSRCGDRTLL